MLTIIKYMITLCLLFTSHGHNHNMGFSQVVDNQPIMKNPDIVDTIDSVNNAVDSNYRNSNNKIFLCYDDYILFVMYLKTQSGRLDDDNWSVIHTLFNRCRKHNVTWREYFNRPNINRSASIRRIKSGDLVTSFSHDNKLDVALIRRVIDADLGYNPTNCPSDVLYFESHSRSPNRGVFLKSRIWKEYRHKFYYGTL